MKIEKIYFENQGEKIESILHSPEIKTDSLIILVHGFTGTMDGPGNLFIKLAEELVLKNFSVLRFNFRYTSEDFSQFDKMTIGGEVSDLKLIIDEMSKRFFRIGLVGESMGGAISILAYNEKIKCLVLWYPAIFLKETDLGKRFLSKGAEKELKETGFIKGKKSDGREYKIGKEFIEELKNINLIPHIQKIQSPTLLIHGENDVVVPFSHSERLLNFLKCPKKLEKIPKVFHAFKNKDFTTDYNLKAQQKAIKLTCKWFEKWLK
jgi:pimeloyl-ACP methyl ester carboxylesterase